MNQGRLRGQFFVWQKRNDAYYPPTTLNGQAYQQTAPNRPCRCAHLAQIAATLHRIGALSF